MARAQRPAATNGKVGQIAFSTSVTFFIGLNQQYINQLLQPVATIIPKDRYFAVDMSHATVTIEAIKVMLMHFEKWGFPKEPFLKAAGIDPQSLNINNHHVSIGAFCKFLNMACEMSGDPALGLRMGDNSNLDSLGIVGQLYRYSATIKEGSLLITKYLPVLHRMFNIFYEEIGDEVHLVYRPTTFEEPWQFGVKQFMELAMAFNRKGLQHSTQSDINPIRIDFTYTLPKGMLPFYEDTFKCPVLENQPQNALVYNKTDCDRPHTFHNPMLVKAFEAYAQEQLSRVQVSGEYYTTVRNCIINEIRNGQEPDAHNISQLIGITENDLAGILIAEGRSFNQILLEVRNEITLGYIGQHYQPSPGDTLMEAVIKAEENERSRIAQELHDGVSGMLAAVKMHFSTLQETNPSFRQSGEFTYALTMLDDASRELRKTAHNLMPEILEEYGLDEALRRYCQNLQHISTAVITYVRTGNPGRFRHNFELAVYRVAQELIHNAIKHAHPKELLVQVSILRQQLLLTIEDDGGGFDPRAINNGMGLHNLMNRVAALGGSINWDSSPDSGTSVFVSFDISPLQSSPD